MTLPTLPHHAAALIAESLPSPRSLTATPAAGGGAGREGAAKRCPLRRALPQR
jgi:hypothetical protein